MKLCSLFSLLFLCVLANAQTRFDVSSKAEFDAAHVQAVAGDSIVWLPGIYSDIRMDIDKDGLIVIAEPFGSVLFKGVSRAVINGNDVTFAGFQYVGGFIANLNVINIFGSDVLVAHVNIQNYTSHKYLVVDEVCRRNTISHCNFENRLNLDDKNILSILVDNEPGFHKIQYCSFKNFNGFGGDLGIEPIRIGVSSQGTLDSRTLVEYCYFTRCNGDGEIISHKSRQNVYRYNTFENNPESELVLRHGDEGIIYGNFFLNNMGGVRIREGSDHFIFNNYFEGIDKRAIYLMNDPVDPLQNVHIYHNTIVNSEEVVLGGSGNNPPTNVTIANNVFANPTDRLFVEDTGNETWIGNLSFGILGIDVPASGISNTDPELNENVEGFFQPASSSPVVSAATEGYPAVPLYPGMDYDHEIMLDLMKSSRPTSNNEKAIGASEYSSTVNVQPHATEMNSGPSYLFDNLVDYIAVNAVQWYIGKEEDIRGLKVSSNIHWTVTSSEDWITTDLSSGSGDGQIAVSIAANNQSTSRSGTITVAGLTDTAAITIFQDAGDPSNVLENLPTEPILFPNPTDGKLQVQNLPSGTHISIIELIDIHGKIIFSKEYQITESELEIDLEKIVSGTYLLNVKFVLQDGTVYGETTRRVIRE